MSESLLSILIANACRWRATAIHIEPFKRYARVRYRIDGVLAHPEVFSRGVYEDLISQIKTTGRMDPDELRRHQDGGFEIVHEDTPWEIQVSVVHSHLGQAAVLRLGLREPRPLDFLELGFTQEQTSQIESALEGRRGLVLFTGAGGSGKTTTTYAALTHLQRHGKRIITVEGFVERILPGVHQCEVGYDTDRAKRLVRAALRQNPEILFVGALRSPDSVDLALSAAQQCLVLSHLHTIDASSALIRLCDMGAMPRMVTASVTAVIAQRLARRVCMHCRTSYTPSVHELGFLCISPDCQGLRFARGAGCLHCRGTGLHDRTVVAEVMTVTPEIGHALATDGDGRKLRRLARSLGVKSLYYDAVYKATQGIIASTEAHHIARWGNDDDGLVFP